MHALYKPIQHFCLITFENIDLGYNGQSRQLTILILIKIKMFNIYGYFKCNLNVKFSTVLECKMVIPPDLRSPRLYKIVALAVRLPLVSTASRASVNRSSALSTKPSFNRRLPRWERSLPNMKEMNINVHVYSKTHFHVFLCENMLYTYPFIFSLLFNILRLPNVDIHVKLIQAIHSLIFNILC